MIFPFFPLLAAATGFVATSRLDVNRRKLSLIRMAGWSFLTFLDVICVAFTIGVASALLFISQQIHPKSEWLSPVTFAIVASIAALFFLWTEGRRQVQLQRPAGIVFAEWALLFSFYQLIAKFAFPQIDPSTIAGWAQTILVIALALG